MTKAKIISPDINKEPIFIISGLEGNIRTAVFLMKLAAFGANGSNYFTKQEFKWVESIFYDSESYLSRCSRAIVNFDKLRGYLPNLWNENTNTEDGLSQKKKHFIIAVIASKRSLESQRLCAATSCLVMRASSAYLGIFTFNVISVRQR